MRDGLPVFHEVHTEGLQPGYWDCFLSLKHLDPLGPRMFDEPGTSILTSQTDFPEVMVAQWMRPYEVNQAISGMAADPSTGVFSVVCWHRDESMPAFTDSERLIHQHLLPHWVECLNIHRLSAALREMAAYAMPGHELVLSEPNGQIHFAQSGVADLLNMEFGSVSAGVLPDRLVAELRLAQARFQGNKILAIRKVTKEGLWFIQMREQSEADSLTPRERQICALLARGYTVKTAARQIQVAPSTVDNLRSLAYRKLGVRNRADLARAIADGA